MLKRIGLRTYAVIFVAVLAGVLIIRSFRPDDAALRQALAGTWIATDPADNALHRRELPVTREEIEFRPGGTLTYSVTMAAQPGAPEHDPWEWRVQRGRLSVRFLGPEGTEGWLPSFKFSVNDHALSIYLKGRPAKKFVRS